MNFVRLWYKKSGLAVYTSHLDMNRCFTRAVRRAGIPLWYTEGFNPHPYLTFLLPLPLGTAGEREPVDIRTLEDMTPEEIKSRLNSVLPEGVEIVDVTQAKDKANEVESALYEIETVFAAQEAAQTFAREAAQIMAGGSLEAEKRSKRGVKTVNLCDYVFGFDASSNGKSAVFRTVLATGTQNNLAVSLLEETLEQRLGASPEKCSITRREIYKTGRKLFE